MVTRGSVLPPFIYALFRERGTLKRRGGNTLLAAAATAVAVVLVELALRAAGISYPGFYTRDPLLGAALRPGAEGRWWKEGKAYVRINSSGMRDREHAREKPSGVLRIAILGDSYAEAFQVPRQETFWSVMERELDRCGDARSRKAEALNFGVSGYGTAQELLVLRHRVREYSPDFVVLALTTGNDVRNNLRELERDPGRPYFHYRDGELTLDDSFLSSWPFRHPALYRLWRIAIRVSDYSRIMQVANQARNVLRERRMAAGAARPEDPLPDGGASGKQGKDRTAPPPAGRPLPRIEAGLDAKVFRPPSDPLWKEAWRVTEGLIGRMDKEAREMGARLLVVTLTSGVQVHPDPSIREGSLGKPDPDGLYYPDRRIRDVCRRNGIPVLNLAPSFQSYAERNGAFLHGSGANRGGGHWNREGHRIAGERIAEAVCGLLGEEVRTGTAPATSRRPAVPKGGTGGPARPTGAPGPPG